MATNARWPGRNAKDQFIEFCLAMDIGETTEELDQEWAAYCAELEKGMQDDQG